MRRGVVEPILGKVSTAKRQSADKEVLGKRSCGWQNFFPDNDSANVDGGGSAVHEVTNVHPRYVVEY